MKKNICSEKSFDHYSEGEGIKRNKIQSYPFSESLKVKENTHNFSTLEKDADNACGQMIEDFSECSVSHCYINKLSHELIWKISMYLCDDYNNFTDFKNMSITCKNIQYVISENLRLTNKILNKWKNSSIEKRKKYEFYFNKCSFLYHPTFAFNTYFYHISSSFLVDEMANNTLLNLHVHVELLKNKNIAVIDRDRKNTIKIWKFIDPNNYQLVDILDAHENNILVFKELNDNRLISIDNNLVKIWNPPTNDTNRYTCESTYLSSTKDRRVNQIQELKNGTIVITTMTYYSDDTFQVWDLNNSKNNEMVHARTFNNTNDNKGSRIEAFKELSNDIACSTHTSGLINLWDFTKKENNACIASFGQDNLRNPQTLIGELKDDSLAIVHNFSSTKIWKKHGCSYTNTQTLHSDNCGNIFSLTVIKNGNIVINHKTGFMKIWRQITDGSYDCVQKLKTLKHSFLLIKLRADRLVIIDNNLTLEAYVLDNNKYIKESVVTINEKTSTKNITHKAVYLYSYSGISIIDMVGTGITYVMPHELKPLFKFSEDPENQINMED